jgi:hypothetical protein
MSTNELPKRIYAPYGLLASYIRCTASVPTAAMYGWRPVHGRLLRQTRRLV